MREPFKKDFENPNDLDNFQRRSRQQMLFILQMIVLLGFLGLAIFLVVRVRQKEKAFLQKSFTPASSPTKSRFDEVLSAADQKAVARQSKNLNGNKTGEPS